VTTPPVDSQPVAATIGVLALRRGQLVAVAIIGLVLGLIGLFFPTTALLFVAIIFGIYLIASGIFRINSAFLVHNLSTGARWLTGLLGVLIVVAGVICLSDPFGTLIVLAYLIGIAWIAEGIVDIMAAVQGSVQPRWLGWVSGIVAVIAGIVIFVLPAAGFVTFLLIASIMLIVVSVTTLLTLPRKSKLA
jgi:uncharacterized membrane protein HdeD (DUF308 family)